MTRVWTLAAATLLTVAHGVAPSANAAPSLHGTARSTPAPRLATVTSVSLTPESGAAMVVIGVTGDVTVKDFTLRVPDKIVLDISGARLALAPRRYDGTDRGGIVDVRYAQYQKSVVRVVLTLSGPRRYTVTKEGNEVRVSLAGEGATFAAWTAGEAQQVAASAPAAQAPAAQAPAAQAEPSPEVAQASLERAEQMPAGAVTEASTSQPMGAREASRDSAAAAAAAAPAATSASVPTVLRRQPSQQPRITVAWQNADIRDVLSAFSAFSGRTIIAGRNVTGTVNAEINDQPWDVAMRAILDAQGLAANEDANGIIVVDTYAEIAQRLQTQLATQRNQPDTTAIIPIENLSATVVASSLRGQLPQECLSPQTAGPATPAGTNEGTQPGQQALQPGTRPIGQPTPGLTCRTIGSVTADSVTNKVMVTGPRTTVGDLLRLAREIDRPERQVAIKAKIVLVQRSRLEQLGVQYDLRTANQFEQGLLVAPAGTSGGTQGQVLLGGNVLSAIANATRAVAAPALRLVYSTAFGDYNLTAFVTMLQDMQLSDIQSEPSVTTLNNRPAELFSGTQVFFTPPQAVTPGAVLAAPQTQLIQAGVTLRVTPRISALGGRIQMNIEAKNSDFVPSPTQPLVTEQRVTNEVTVSDGETVVLGGLTQTTVRVVKSGIPVLMDLPLIGRLFGFTSRGEEKRDLLILITPHIIEDGRTGPAGAPLRD